MLPGATCLQDCQYLQAMQQKHEIVQHCQSESTCWNGFQIIYFQFTATVKLRNNLLHSQHPRKKEGTISTGYCSETADEVRESYSE